MSSIVVFLRTLSKEWQLGKQSDRHAVTDRLCCLMFSNYDILYDNFHFEFTNLGTKNLVLCIMGWVPSL